MTRRKEVPTKPNRIFFIATMKKAPSALKKISPSSITKMSSGVALRMPRGPVSKAIRSEIEREVKKSADVRGFRAGFEISSIKRVELEEE